jgi:hypothetical protein
MAFCSELYSLEPLHRRHFSKGTWMALPPTVALLPGEHETAKLKLKVEFLKMVGKNGIM